MAANQAATSENEVVQILMQFPFFRSFNERLLQQLAELSAYVTVRKGENLLTQGQMNSNLYILVKGSLSVVVDGAKVASLTNPGDLVGEMSVISNKACSATIRVESDSELYRLKADELQQIRGPDEDRIQHLLYRIYSQVLADKLSHTNQKAKRFEEMAYRLEEAQTQLKEINKDLEEKVVARTKDLEAKTSDLISSSQKLEQKHAEVIASHRKLEELYLNRASTFSQLQDLYKNHLIPLRTSLDGLAGVPDPATRKLTTEVKSEVQQALKMLEPITALYSTELAMRSKRVLLSDSNKKQQINAKMALGGTGVQLEIVDNLDEAKQKLSSEKFDIMFLDSKSLDLVAPAVEHNPSVRTVLMTSDYIPKYLDQLTKLSFMPNIVSRSEEDRTFTIKNIVTTVTKLVSHDIFGLEKYLAWGVDVKEVPVTKSEERSDLIQKMDQHFESLGVRRSNRERCGVVAEELLMNCIYDAPVDGNGKSLYNHLPRTVPVNLQPEHFSRFRFATDGVLLAISVEDPFGSLSGHTILKYLQSCYGGQAGSLNTDKGGAGRGLHQIVENSDLVVFNLQPGRRTEVISLFNVDLKTKAVDYPTFHLFIG